MKILMLLDRQFPPDVRVENEASSMIKEGHEVHVLSYAFESLPLNQTINQINIHRFRIHEQVAKKSLGLFHLLPFFKMIWKGEVRKILKKHPFDIIHIHDLPLCFQIPYLKSKGYRVIADMHENYPYLVEEQPYIKKFPWSLIFSSRKWFSVEKKWLSKADHIVVVAEEMKHRLERVLPESSSFIIVPNMINLDRLDKLEGEIPDSVKLMTKDKFNVIYVGGFDETRGIHLLIQAARILLPLIPELKVLLVGDGSNRRNLEELVIRDNLSNQVHFTGWLSASMVLPLIKLCQVCVIPHLKNTQTDNSSPNKLFQYMYCKKPVISSNCSSLERIIMETSSGLIFENNNPEDLADKIGMLYRDPDCSSKLGKNGFDAVKDRFNWEVGNINLRKKLID